VFDVMPPNTLFAERHVVTVQSLNAGHRKIFAVSFGKDDSVYVHMPYFQEEEGLLLRCIGRLNDGQATVERVELPHTIGSRVKFSYHRNGRAHFSQDGKVKTVVIDSLPPLVVHDGVLFQLQAYNFDHYDSVKPRDQKGSSKKTLVDCTPNPTVHGVVVTGYLSKPGMCAVESSGEPKLIARSPHSPFLIALGYKPLKAPMGYNGAFLIFLGGPSAPAIIAPGASRSVLVAVYPRGAGTILYPDAVSADFEAD
jgi:hypothetical protein